jgi:hypothetical protein
MIPSAYKSVLNRFVSLLVIIILFGVFLLPAMAEALETDCDDCSDDCESVCGCMGCPPVILAHEMPIPEYDPTLNVLTYIIIDLSNDYKCDLFDRLDRPPKRSSTGHL